MRQHNHLTYSFSNLGFALPWLIGTTLLVVIPTLSTFFLAFWDDGAFSMAAFQRLFSSDLVSLSFFQ
ncbi:MAG: hypothetical protein AAGD96_07275 [Chloroflexota bacterium]